MRLWTSSVASETTGSEHLNWARTRHFRAVHHAGPHCLLVLNAHSHCHRYAWVRALWPRKWGSVINLDKLSTKYGYRKNYLERNWKMSPNFSSDNKLLWDHKFYFCGTTFPNISLRALFWHSKREIEEHPRDSRHYCWWIQKVQSAEIGIGRQTIVWREERSRSAVSRPGQEGSSERPRKRISAERNPQRIRCRYQTPQVEGCRTRTTLSLSLRWRH